MRRSPRRLSLPAVLFILCGICGAPAAAATQEGKTAARSGEGGGGDPMARVLPEVSFQDVAFDDVVDYLRDVSGFQAVIVRDPGVPAGTPLIRVRLKSVPLRQLLDVLRTAHPEIEMEPVEGGDAAAPVWVIRIRAAEGADATSAVDGAAAGARGGKVVRVYPLTSEIMTVLKAGGELAQVGPQKEAMKKGLEHVLSLLEGVIQAAGEKAPPTLAVHEETQSLIVTGTTEQQARVQETLASLRGERPYDQQQIAMARAQQQMREIKLQTEEEIQRLQRQIERLGAELQEARTQAAQAEDQARKQAIEAERIQVRMEDAMKRSKGSTETTTERTKSSTESSAPPASGAK